MTRPVKAVVFDLDGTLLDTETLVLEVVTTIVERYGKKLTPEALQASSGRRPLEAWQAVADLLGIDRSAQQLFDESEPLLEHRWHEAKLLPGAGRLLRHLHKHGVPVALATSTSRATLEKKLSGQHSWATEVFTVVSCGDEVTNGKPAPDCFRAAAHSLDVDPRECLAVEDAPSGVEAAAAAGMRVVVIPSLRNAAAYPDPSPGAATGCCAVLPSLFEFKPEQFGLPPFDDLIDGQVIPVEPPWQLRGTVVKGFGRGSKELGIPTANLDSASLQSALAEAVTGIYCGWSSIGNSPEVYPMVTSVGWNPFFKNDSKTCEPWLLHKFDNDFYDKELRLLVCGYIRPETNFDSLDALIARIHKDADETKSALLHPSFAHMKSDDFLAPSTAESKT